MVSTQAMTRIETAGVVGAGTMGNGIAQALAQAGVRTVLFDVTPAQADAGLQRIGETLEQGVSKGKVTAEQRSATLALLSTTVKLEQLADCDAVIEAIPEQLHLKLELFGRLKAILKPGALWATNTSSLSVTELAAAAADPSRVVGMHFFNPVHAMKLVEVVRPLQASDETVAQARELAGRLGKQVVEVKDHPGFASSRLGILLGMEAIRMVEEGVGRPEDIDRAMELGYGHPMGPLKLTDLVGLDVRLSIAQHLYAELGSPAFRPPQLLKRMVRAGKLGRKSGEGFYRY